MRHDLGMTLIELVVALTVTGIALSAGYGAFATITDQRTRAVHASDARAGEVAVRERLGTWFAAARLDVADAGVPFRGIDGTFERRPDDGIEFLTTGLTPVDASPVRVHLYIDHDRETPDSGLVVEFTDPRTEHRVREILVPTARTLDARYLGRVAGGREWDDSWISSSLLPLGVQLTLTDANGVPLDGLLALPMTLVIGGGR